MKTDSPDLPIVIHVHQPPKPVPITISNDEDAKTYLGLSHKRTVYRHLGVPVTELPSSRFAVLVKDVEKALRERGAVPKRETSRRADADLLAAIAASGLRVSE
jgi:hypothetical protein